MKISIIIPVRNEAENIGRLLHELQEYRDRGHELIVVDSGSEDETVCIARPLADYLLEAPAGRARQMNAGARIANGDVLWFLHADSQAPDYADELIKNALTNSASTWGRFDIRLSGSNWSLRIVESMMNLRSRLTGIATGDQAIFIHHDLFDKVGGFPDQCLMEDVEISKMLKKFQAPVSLREKLVTSSRRWEQNGVLRTIFLMWLLRAAYFFGVPAEKLCIRYG
ncbi:MAG: TIGR04283 family arsenosugar biosynthesis glycosyltransferase [Arenicellales bacterium]|jgi:rSAM/selenodomain-associated transferase 2